MSINSKKEIIKAIKQRKYLNKDFSGLKQDLIEYARTHFPNNIKDLSEAGVVGMLIELASYVGDVDSFYLDHQFHETNIDTAVETRNIQALLKKSGVQIVGSSPAVVNNTFLVEVPADSSGVDNTKQPSIVAQPVIRQGTIVPSNSGVQFELTEDLDFSETDASGKLLADVVISQTDSNNNPTTFILSRKGVCISGFVASETFTYGQFQPFKKFTLARENVTDIISIVDNQGNTFYQVGYLTQDSVFQAITNKNSDNKIVKDLLVITPAPFRFIAETSIETRLTTVTFGGGSAQSLDDDIVPDPSEFAIPFYGKRTFSRFTLDPYNLLKTTTLGVVVPNSTLTVTYRYGGGLSHNVTARTIRGFTSLDMEFPNNPTPTVAQFVRSSADSINEENASGGEDAPTIDELKTRAPAVKASQSRIVTKPDILARIYTMPSNFGRVFRAACRTNLNNPLASNIFIVSRNAQNQLVTSPDTLKDNLSNYLNQFRLTNDAYDILDAKIINIKVSFSIAVDSSYNKNLLKQNIIAKLTNYFNIKNFEIDQPIVLNDLENLIYNTQGVLTVVEVKILNVHGDITTTDSSGTTVITRSYSQEQYDIDTNTEKKIVFAPAGGIFEVKFKDTDITGVVL